MVPMDDNYNQDPKSGMFLGQTPDDMGSMKSEEFIQRLVSALEKMMKDTEDRQNREKRQQEHSDEQKKKRTEQFDKELEKAKKLFEKYSKDSAGNLNVLGKSLKDLKDVYKQNENNQGVIDSLTDKLHGKAFNGNLIANLANGTQNDFVGGFMDEAMSKAMDVVTGGLAGPLKMLADAVGQVGTLVAKEMDKHIDYYEQLWGKAGTISSLLQGDGGIGPNLEQLVNSVNKTNAGLASGVIKLTDLTTHSVEIIEKGYLHDVEQNALIASISKNVASSYDVLSQQLIQLNRLNGTTQGQRLGLEAAVQNFFSNNFGDVDYLQSDFYDTVTNSLMQAESRMTASMAAEFEFSVQKWLGSLYESGASTSFVENLAKSLGQLASGDVSGLNSNNPMMALLASAASRGNSDIGSLLNRGMTSSDIDSLMYQVVQMIGGMSQSVSGQNVRGSALGNVFGSSLIDMQAIQNLSANQQLMEAITGRTQSNWLKTLDSELGLLTSNNRLAPFQRLINTTNNSIDDIASSMFDNDGRKYKQYKIAGTIADMQLGDWATDLARGSQLAAVGKSAVKSIFDNVIPSIGGFFNRRFNSDYNSAGIKIDSNGNLITTRLSSTVGSNPRQYTQEEILSEDVNTQLSYAQKTFNRTFEDSDSLMNQQKATVEAVNKVQKSTYETQQMMQQVMSGDNTLNINIQSISDGLQIPIIGTEQIKEMINEILVERLRTIDLMSETLVDTVSDSNGSPVVDVNLKDTNISLQEMLLKNKQRTAYLSY